jgi:hypothetical protein
MGLLYLTGVAALLLVPASFFWSPPAPAALVIVWTGLVAVVLFEILGGLGARD